MKLYFTTYVDDAAETYEKQFKVRWYGTQAEQKRDAKALKSEGMRAIDPDVFDVPTNKADLLQFLNDNEVHP